MIPRRTLEIASFWEQDVCLDCEAIQPPEAEEPTSEADGDEPLTCCACGSQSLLPAETILQVAALVGEDE